MIIEDKIEILITPRNITYYRNLNYVVKFNDKILIPIEHLPLTCKMEVTCRCECGAEIKMRYEKYVINVNRCGYYGCKKCSNKKRVVVSQEKWGVDNYSQTQECKDLVASNNMEKYGVKTTLLLDEVKAKIKATNLEKYNFEQPLSSNIVIEKRKATLIKKYGVEHYSKTEEFKIKYSKRINKGREDIIKNVFNVSDFRINDENVIVVKCLKQEHEYEISYKNLYQRKIVNNIEPCTICNPIINSSVSGHENNIYNFILENYDGEIIQSNKTILNGKEIDIYLPELHLAFEYNGLFWHCELYKDKNYHLDKTVKCLENGIQLIHIYEDEWKYNNEIVKYKILNLLKKNNKIGARKCIIKEVSNKESKIFQELNHIQGYVNSKVNIGLFYNDELMSLMTFGSLRKHMGSKSENETYELLRLCTKLNYNIVGGASKLFKYFIQTYNPEKIISYADKSWSSGNLYYNLGFDFISHTVPNYWYVNRDKRLNRFNFRKDVLIKEGFDPLKSEHEIMLERGYYRIYNSGNLKFEWKKSILPFPSHLS